MLFHPALIITLHFLTTGANDISHQLVEVRLRSVLLENYQTSIRPIYNHTNPVNVTVNLVLQHVIEVYWTDEFIGWNASKHEDISSLRVKSQSIWIPDICLYNSLYPAIYAKDLKDFRVQITDRGEVQWLAPVIVESICRYNVRHFPFDTQVCAIQLGSWTYNGLQLDLFLQNPQGELKYFENNVEWIIEGFPATKILKVYSCCPEPYPLIQYSLILKRKPTYHVFYLFLPAIIITIASLFSFYLPPGCEAKVDLAVTGLLSQTVFLLLISDLMPPDAHNPPLLGECLSLLLITQVLAVALNVIVNRWHDDVTHKRELPSRWISKLAHYLKYPLFLWHIDYKKFHSKLYTEIVRPIGLIKPTVSGSKGVFDETVSESNSKLKSDTSKQLDEILIHIHQLSQRSEGKIMQEKIASHWRHIIVLYDRILMVIFIIGVIAITVWFVTLSPPDV